jgi:hypothetical protein
VLEASAAANGNNRGAAMVEWRPPLDRLRAGGAVEVYRAPFPFSSLAILGKRSLLGVEYRVRAADASWTDWTAVGHDDGPPTRTGEEASGLISVAPSHEVQLRLGPASPEPPSSLRVVLFGDDGGPAVPAPRVSVAQAEAPRIVTRAEWGADPSLLRWPAERAPVRKFAIHHTASSDGGANPAASIRAIYRYHADTLGWGDIGYNYLIDRNGLIYEGRAGGPNTVAAHSGLHSAGADGIALLGTFEDVRPSEPMMTALARLIAWRARTQGIDPRGSSQFVDRVLPNVFAHRDVAVTDCPGDAVYALLPGVRQQAASLMGAPATRPGLAVLGTRISPLTSRPGELLKVEVTLRNTGSEIIPTQGPSPGFLYDARDTFASLGHLGEPGRVRIGVEVDGDNAVDHRYRWGLGTELAPGEVRTVGGSIRLDSPGLKRAWVGVVQEHVAWLQDNVGQTPISVFPPGAASYGASSTPGTELYIPLVMRDNPSPGGWTTRIALANPGDRPATGSVSFVDRDGNVLVSGQISLAARGSAQYDVGGVTSLPPPFAGAAVVRASVPLVGVALHDRSGSDRMAAEAVAAGATRLYAPLVAHTYRGLSTGLQVQNVGSAPTVATATYISSSGETWSQSASIPPMASATLYTPSAPGLPSDFVGSAVIESDGQPLAAVVNAIRNDGIAMSYVALPGGSPVATAPLLYRNRGGWVSGLQVQNLSSAPANVVATYQPTTGTGGPWEERATLGFGIATSFYLPAVPDMPDDVVVAGVVRALEGQSLLALAQNLHAQRRVGSAVIAPPSAGATLHAPLVSNDAEGWRSGVQLQNAGAAPAPVTLTFYDQQGATVVEVDDTVPPGGSRTYYLPALLGLPVGYTGSLTIQGRPDAMLSAVVNDVR